MESQESNASYNNSTDDPDYEPPKSSIKESNFNLGFSSSDEENDSELTEEVSENRNVDKSLESRDEVPKTNDDDADSEEFLKMNTNYNSKRT